MNHNIGGDLLGRSDNALVSSSPGLDAKQSHGISSGGIRLPASSSEGGFATRNRPDEFLGDEGFGVADGNDVSGFFSSHLRCDQPTGLAGKGLLEMEPHRFCDAPLILKVAIQDIQPYSVLVSWQTREHSGLHGYHVVYRPVAEQEDGVFSDSIAVSATLNL